MQLCGARLHILPPLHLTCTIMVVCTASLHSQIMVVCTASLHLQMKPGLTVIVNVAFVVTVVTIQRCKGQADQRRSNRLSNKEATIQYAIQ